MCASRAREGRAADVISLPAVDAFTSEVDYFATAFHELAHWTAPRVGREVNAKRFGDNAYAMEELVAAMVCGVCNLPMLMQSVSYLDHWLGILREDKRAIFGVASAARRAADTFSRKPATRKRPSSTTPTRPNNGSAAGLRPTPQRR